MRYERGAAWLFGGGFLLTFCVLVVLLGALWRRAIVLCILFCVYGGMHTHVRAYVLFALYSHAYGFCVCFVVFCLCWSVVPCCLCCPCSLVAVIPWHFVALPSYTWGCGRRRVCIAFANLVATDRVVVVALFVLPVASLGLPSTQHTCFSVAVVIFDLAVFIRSSFHVRRVFVIFLVVVGLGHALVPSSYGTHLASCFGVCKGSNLLSLGSDCSRLCCVYGFLPTPPNSGAKMLGGFSEVGKKDFLVYFVPGCVFFDFFFDCDCAK